MNGHFSAGEWPDQKPAQAGINHHLDDCEYHLKDGGYYDRGQWVEMPIGHNTGTSNALAACLLYTGIHCITMQQCIVACHNKHYTAHHHG